MEATSSKDTEIYCDWIPSLSWNSITSLKFKHIALYEFYLFASFCRMNNIAYNYIIINILYYSNCKNLFFPILSTKITYIN